MDKIRAKFTKCENSKYISHLDLMRLFQRAFRRAGLHLKHTEGFNPQPKLAFATALSLGTSSDGEYMDVEVEENIEIKDFIETINKVLPEGVKVLNAEYRTEKDSIASLIRWGSYVVEVTLDDMDISSDEVNKKLSEFLSLDEIIVTKEVRDKKRRGHRKIVEDDIKDKINKLDILSFEENKISFKMTLKTGSNGNIKPELLLEAFEKYTEIKIGAHSTKIHRLDLFIEQDGEMITPL